MRTPARICKQPTHPMPVVYSWLRMRSPGSVSPGLSTPVLFSIVGIALLFVPDWLGGPMVQVYGVGVEGRNSGTAAAIPRSGG
ncbi:hypothetical protein VOM14_30685 [Paraburkholderia sp. MPAMCS5]|uniref:hypothetical protein n=1 Tax=Paraburkholderia sp. MPAMCS5 TaxID=3112563 RepID=UPI002E19F280|nr:hypothetical protein [Paraburkholderia sp. MPAMCS5]